MHSKRFTLCVCVCMYIISRVNVSLQDCRIFIFTHYKIHCELLCFFLQNGFATRKREDTGACSEREAT